MTRSFKKTEEALVAYDAGANGDADASEIHDLGRACAKAFAEDTKDINDPETVLGIFHAAPPLYVRAVVAEWRFPKHVKRLKELSKDIDEAQGYASNWYEHRVAWVRFHSPLSSEDGQEFGRLIRHVGLAIGPNNLA